MRMRKLRRLGRALRETQLPRMPMDVGSRQGSTQPCMGLEESRGNSEATSLLYLLDQFLGSTEAFLRPDRGLARAPRADAVKPGRRPPPEAARSGLDGGEHGASMAGSGRLGRDLSRRHDPGLGR